MKCTRETSHSTEIGVGAGTAASHIAEARFSRRPCSLEIADGEPATANSFGQQLRLRQVIERGKSSRLVRSPVMPKITMTQGPAGSGSTCLAVASGGCAQPCASSATSLCRVPCVRRNRCAWPRAFSRRSCVPGGNGSAYRAGGEHLAGTASGRPLDGPAAFAGVLHEAGEFLEVVAFGQGHGGEVEQPGGDHAAAAPDFGDIGEARS